MSNLVIVAIPAADELVWKVSSEKVPHLTLLFLGPLEQDDNVQRMADFIEHAVEVSEHGPFYLEVDHRGTLGSDNADVLFFRNDRSSKWINSFRGQLLQQNDIRAEFEEMEAAGQQYPEWTPHLTLGYPETPAKPVPDDRSIYSVMFDRIALWTGDYDGPEFRLEWPERDNDYPALAYSLVGKGAVENLLEHHGVLGMKWGVRRALERAKSNASDKNFKLQSNSNATVVHLVNTARDKTTKNDLPKINSKYAPQGAKTSGRVHLHSLSRVPVQQAYRKEVQTAYLKNLNAAAREMKSQTGNLQYEIVRPRMRLGAPTATHWRVRAVQATHAALTDTNINEFDVIPVFDADGFIIDFKHEAPQTDTSLAQSAVTHASVLDSPTLRQQIEDKLKDILEDVTGDADGDVALFGDPLLRAKVTSVLNDLYNMGVDEGVAQSAMDEVLTHHGVKGMKWGVRHEVTGGGLSSSQSAKLLLMGNLATVSPKFNKYTSTRTQATATVFGPLALMDGKVRADLKQASQKVALGKADKQWDHAIKSGEAYVAVNNAASEHFNAHIDRVNSKHQSKNDWSNEPYNNPSKSKDPEFRAYMKDVDKLTQDSIAHAANKLYLQNPSGTKSVEITSPHVGSYKLRVKQVAHDAQSDPVLNILVNFQHGADGFVTGFDFDDDAEDLQDNGADEATEVAQSAIQNGEEFVQDYLSHHGVLGMRWGVRRDRSEPTAVPTVAKSRVPQWSRRKTKIDVEGGHNHPAHPDAMHVAKARAKFKKSGPAALSNQELRDMANRLLLENQVHVLTSHKGKQFVSRQLEAEGQSLARRGLREGVKRAAKTGTRAAATGLATAALV